MLITDLIIFLVSSIILLWLISIFKSGKKLKTLEKIFFWISIFISFLGVTQIYFGLSGNIDQTTLISLSPFLIVLFLVGRSGRTGLARVIFKKK